MAIASALGDRSVMEVSAELSTGTVSIDDSLMGEKHATFEESTYMKINNEATGRSGTISFESNQPLNICLMPLQLNSLDLNNQPLADVVSNEDLSYSEGRAKVITKEVHGDLTHNFQVPVFLGDVSSEEENISGTVSQSATSYKRSSATSNLSSFHQISSEVSLDKFESQNYSTARGGDSCRQVHLALASHEDSSELTVIVAGRSRCGKTTLLNNVFGLSLTAKACVESVTTRVCEVKVIKNGVKVTVIDTPGLTALDISWDDYARQVNSLKSINNGFIFLYCLSVSPNTSITEVEIAAVKKLPSLYGKHIWEMFCLILTFSDHAREENELEEDYIACMKYHTKKFQTILKESGVKYKDIKTIFDKQSRPRFTGPVAIPVQRKTDRGQAILPGIFGNDDWTEVVFTEIQQRSKPSKSSTLLETAGSWVKRTLFS